VMSPLMSKADKHAEAANPKGIERLNYGAMAALGLFFAFVVVLGLIGGSAVGSTLQALSDKYAWIMNGLGAAGGMMRYVGFAILLRIMLSKDLWGVYFAGFALATIIGKIEGLAVSALL
ncbi:PTS sugar transporter subunit IIC, partial [Clostridium perfringens]|uniref:PTS sugar transporter subunit IIC n=1 Tax=Clostridium perfringens TaxID=1502 RepID=UPI002ACBF570